MKLTKTDIIKVFGLYLGCEAIFDNGVSKAIDGAAISSIEQTGNEGSYSRKIVLKALSQITHKDAIEIATLTFVGLKIDWEITKRNASAVWMNGVGKYDIRYYLCLNDYGAVYSSTIFPDKTVDHNIGGVQLDVKDGIPYMLIVDRLREMGYALPYKGADLFKAGLAIDAKTLNK